VLTILAAVVAIAAPSLPAIHCDGEALVLPDGRPILLRGVNLGGWLVEEPWMTPWKTDPPAGSSEPKASNHVDLWNAVENHLGREAMLRVRNAWRDNWITDTDFRLIHEAGFNHVRIPFLESIVDEPGGLARLHKAVGMAAAAGLYVVLDMHGAPGGQSKEDHTGQGGRNHLWTDPRNVMRMEEVWTRLGREFKGSEVAMFDLMNEPMGAPNNTQLYEVYDRVVRAIRKVDPDKVLLVEDGYKGFDGTPVPSTVGWANVCYSLHFYQFDAKTSQEHVDAVKRDIARIRPLQDERQAPMYIGEFNLEPHAGSDVTRQYVDELVKQGWSYAIWAWKADPVQGTLGQWGVMKPIHPTPAIDPFTDSEATMMQKIAQVRTENFEPIPGLLSALAH